MISNVELFHPPSEFLMVKSPHVSLMRYACKPCQVPECQVCTKDRMICALEGKGMKKGKRVSKNLVGQEVLVD